MIGNLCFIIFVIGVLIFIIIVVIYEFEDFFFYLFDKIFIFFIFISNVIFDSDNTVVKIGEDFLVANQIVFNIFINIIDVVDVVELAGNSGFECEVEVGKFIDCKDLEVFYIMMRVVIEKFKDIYFYRFGKFVRGLDDNICDMVWRFRFKEGKIVLLYKDYRRFVVLKFVNCFLIVIDIGDYYSGMNVRKRKLKK